MNPKPTWKSIAQRAIPAQMQRAQNKGTTQLTPTQTIFRDTLLENLPPGTGTNATIDNHITYIIIPTINRENIDDKHQWICNTTHEPPRLTPLIAIIYWNQKHIEIQTDNPLTSLRSINRADPNWLQQLLNIIEKAQQDYQQTSS